jgi:predicted lipoprotein with Yx(FWY)xxD motif
MVRYSRTLALLAAIVLVAAACSSAASPSTSSAASSSAAPSTPASASAGASASAAAGVTLAVAEDATLGKFLTGDAGKTLYTFTNDTEANKSTCLDQCIANWPPLLAPAGAVPAAPTGVTGTFAAFARPDGAMQVSYNGKPLYYYSKDTKAGDTTGQGVGGKWFVAAP